MKAKILIVEDNPQNLYLIEFLLRSANIATVSAANGEQALAMARSERPDLILMDIQMPEMDGYEATRKLKSDPETRNIPVIGVSSYAMPSSRKEALAAGMAAYIEKPLIPETFLSQLQPFLP
ncbi:response regulator [Methylomonas sp. SURF-1]|uniref:Response regulator n=1 Tax=Methylomonas aurea TaxID=2952224 RepID=A0ABT1UHY5_9GAMM|nr:response regulator [Methylomonas sp. SURF-1]MCQ8181810.1 response regulator [Methylomonas sp. SURF-1]